MSRELTEAPVQGLIRKMALAASIGFFFNTMYNVVDTYFGGKISTTALAAMSLSFPVFFLVIIFDSGTSTGTTALLANIVGEGDLKRQSATPARCSPSASWFRSSSPSPGCSS